MIKKTLVYSRLGLLLCCLLAAAGCAISNEGAADYRYQNSAGSLEKYVKPAKIEATINPGDPLVVSIKQVYIDDFSEFASPLRIVRGEPANGEIAIVVNAFEKCDGQVNFGPSGLENARVVFFSDDVWEGQFLNLSNLSTVYGPLKYNGTNFILDFYIVEFDQPGEQLRQLVTNLSELGTTFYPPASPIAGALSKLAGSLITDQQEDRVFHYTFELKPFDGGDLNLETGILQTGNYAFIREGDRGDTTQWDNLAINSSDGRIVYKKIRDQEGNEKKCTPNSQTPAECYYRENSYIVVEINKAKTSLQNDMTQMLYKDLVADLSDMAPAILREGLSEGVLTDLSSGISHLKNSDQMMQDINVLESEAVSDEINKSTCTNFLDLWFGTKEDGSLKYNINSIDKERMDRRLSELVLHCEKKKDAFSQDTVFTIMDDIRNRKISSGNKLVIYNSLSCKYKSPN